MMKSIAQLDSIPQYDDFVLVSSDVGDGNDDYDDGCLGDADSYDYCEDALDESSIHQTLTSTSNPLQAVQENFFSETPAIIPSPRLRTVQDSSFYSFTCSFDLSQHNDNGEPGGRQNRIFQELVVPSSSAVAEAVSDFNNSSVIDPSADEVSFNASTTDSSQIVSELVVSEQEVSQLLLQVSHNFEISAAGDSQVVSGSGLEPTAKESAVSGHDEVIRVVEFSPAEQKQKDGTNHKNKKSVSKKDTVGATLSVPLPASMIVSPQIKSQEGPQNDTGITDTLGEDEASTLSSYSPFSTPSKSSGDNGSSNNSSPSIINKKQNKKKRRQQLKIAKKAAAAAAALGGQLTMPRTAPDTTGSSPADSAKRKGRSGGLTIKASNIATAEALKSHQEYKLLTATAGKKLR